MEASGRSIRLGKAKPLKLKDFPPYPGFRALMGPGILLAAFSLGSGELIWWPYLASKYGEYFLWLMIPAGLMQWWINLELARWVLLTGESVWMGYRRISRLFSVTFWAMAIITLAWWGGYASASGTALAALTGLPFGWDPQRQTLFWSYAIILFCVIALTFSRIAYKLVENVGKIVVVISTIGIFIVAFHPTIIGHWSSFVNALFTPHPLPPSWDPVDAGILITSIAYLGLGGFWQLTYPAWHRDKGLGLARYAGRVTSLVTGKPEVVPTTGFAPHDTPENRRRYKRWLRYLYFDNSLGVGVNLLTTLLLAFLAFAILRPMGVYPQGYRICVEQAHFFGNVWGALGYSLFLFIAFFFIGDTYLVILDFVPRLYTDILNSTFERSKKKPYRWWYYFWLFTLAAWTCVTLQLAAPGPLIVWGGVLNFMAWPILHVAQLYLNYVALPKAVGNWVKPGTRWLLIGVVVTVVYASIAVWYVGVVFGLF